MIIGFLDFLCLFRKGCDSQLDKKWNFCINLLAGAVQDVCHLDFFNIGVW